MSKLPLVSFLIFALLQVATSKFPIAQSYKSLQLIFRGIVEQHSLSGFVIWRAATTAKTKSSQEQIVLSAIAKLSDKTFVISSENPSKFLISRGKRWDGTRSLSLIKAFPTNCLFTCLISRSTDSLKVCVNNFHRLMAHSSKLLIINVNGKSDLSYSKFLRDQFKILPADVEVLSISSNKRSSELIVKAHRLNYFSNSYTTQDCLSSEVKWFQPKAKNLHGHKFNIVPAGKSRYPSGNETSRVKSLIAVDLSLKVMNATPRFLPSAHRGRIDMEYSKNLMVSGYRLRAFLAPPEQLITRLLVPAIHDQICYFDFIEFFSTFLCLTVVSTVCAIGNWSIGIGDRMIRVHSLFERFHGVGESRHRLKTSLISLLMSMLALRLFYCSDLTSGLGSDTLIERYIYWEDDLRFNNITVVLSPDEDYSEFLIRSGCYRERITFNTSEVQRVIRNTLIVKNTSVSMRLFEALGVQVPSAIEINRETAARISHIVASQDILAWELHRSDFYADRLSAIYSRAMESRSYFNKDFTRKLNNYTNQYRFLDRLIEESQEEDPDFHFIVLDRLCLHLLLLLGNFLTLVTLLVEKCVFTFKRGVYTLRY